MAEDNFDVAKLAAYLHLTPEQIVRMAQRDKLPGRRVGGEWRFSEAEVHHWLEERIGASDIEQLDEVDAVLVRNQTSNDDVLDMASLSRSSYSKSRLLLEQRRL